ncbi:hypothetical protein ASPZODRAFT_112721 [Penicilliopsis zonata CBS 506.65]|uniref:Amino acid transporter transmembrane domain-containing protein n=1 Tax=Penicilliopsis zonata CBS 506.65 TaxID=1073090 RepID=A0A1L9SM14_9EURO|nr:hypothetical protein ASPZODRAFT_112721 [Penicilliopsis zonata CBS 506.65]OJJ48146.1 hypothetical protein ASPZODRAFT_112721 [Penicilliopsis zonata CBS 506.65]
MSTFVSAANLGGVADPRLGGEADAIGTSDEHRADIAHEIEPPILEGHGAIYNDRSITFENYHYWATRSREIEKHIRTDNQGFSQIWSMIVGKKIEPEPPVLDASLPPLDQENPVAEKITEKAPGQDTSKGSDGVDRWGITETEWERAQRATRTATWGSIFYLITTDILGPTNVPWAISQMGYGPGFALYTVFGGLACYSGMQLWKIFVGLDSTRFPMRNYGDVAFRVFGNWARQGVNVLQSFQFFLNIALIVESSGQSLAQMAEGASGTGSLCFVLAEFIFLVIGACLGQIRTLQRLSWLSNIAIWLNVIVVIMTMIVVQYYPPNYAAAEIENGVSYGPIETSANWPSNSTFSSRISGIMNCIFAYGGATLFNELMAEMRRPYDFWKGFICAEVFIYICYLVSGMVVYSAQGQFTYSPSYQGIPDSAYNWQTLGNALSFITGAIAGILYGNIGIKVFYSAVLRDIFNFPALDKKKGKIVWVCIVPVYWSLAFVVAAAIPQIVNLTTFVGALCIQQFSYTFPPLLLVGYNVQKDAILPEEEFDPRTGQANRVDHGFKRWIRGFKKQLAWNTFDLLYSLAALATAGLGLWAAIVDMRADFAETPLTPFTCTSPTG